MNRRKLLLAVVTAAVTVVMTSGGQGAALQRAPSPGPSMRYPLAVEIRAPKLVVVGKTALYTIVAHNAGIAVLRGAYVSVPPFQLAGKNPPHTKDRKGGYTFDLPAIKPGKSYALLIRIWIKPSKTQPAPPKFGFIILAGIKGDDSIQSSVLTHWR